MWRDALTVKPGTVQVTVLPPIDVSAWPADQIRAKTAEVQAMFADTLAHWPGGPQPPAREGPAAATVPAKKAAAKKTPAKKTAAKKVAAKKTTAKKTALKTAAKKAAPRER
jgi:putative phosphoserine phosphatase/1-acylglycerol-3-phosphate O-acyltransferase